MKNDDCAPSPGDARFFHVLDVLYDEFDRVHGRFARYENDWNESERR